MLLMALVTALVMVPVFQKGTFIDGMLYKTVAFNYYQGISTFWNMRFTETSMSFFCEQPPLYFFVLGSYYKLVGNSWLADAFFMALLFVAIVICSRRIIKVELKEFKVFQQLFLLLLISVPVICWSFANQVIEPFVCLMMLMAILAYQRFYKTNKFLYLILFFVFIFLLFLSKGYQSCFIVLLPFIHFYFNKSKQSVLFKFSASAVLFGAILYAFLQFLPAAKSWYLCYYQTRLVLTMQNIGSTTSQHSEIIFRFVTELAFCLISLAGIFAWLKVKRHYPFKMAWCNFKNNSFAFSLFICSFAGSLPFALSLVQRGFYLLPAIVCFLLSVVIGFKRYWFFYFDSISKLMNVKWIQLSTLILFTASIWYFSFQFANYKRDEQLYKDLEKIELYLSPHSRVLVEGDLWNYFALHACLYLDKQVSIQKDGDSKFLILSKEQQTVLHQGFKKVPIETMGLDLYVKE